MKTKLRSILSLVTAASCLVLAGGCSKDTRSGASDDGAEAAADVPGTERPSERVGTNTGNTGQGRGDDAGSRPISGMSGSPTGTAESETPRDQK